MIKTKFVSHITVTDPDSGLPVELEIRKLETGAMVGIDGSYLEQDIGQVCSPYDKGCLLEIKDDEPAEPAEPAEEFRSVAFSKYMGQVTVKVEWNDLKEGYNGDYNPKDPDDVHLLRFDVSTKHDNEDDFEAVESASYCSLVPFDTPQDTLIKGLEVIMSNVIVPLAKQESVKRICEKLSWLDVETIEKGYSEL